MIPKDLHDSADAPEREASAGGDPVEERLPGDENDLEEVIVRGSTSISPGLKAGTRIPFTILSCTP